MRNSRVAGTLVALELPHRLTAVFSRKQTEASQLDSRQNFCSNRHFHQTHGGKLQVTPHESSRKANAQQAQCLYQRTTNMQGFVHALQTQALTACTLVSVYVCTYRCGGPVFGRHLLGVSTPMSVR